MRATLAILFLVSLFSFQALAAVISSNSVTPTTSSSNSRGPIIPATNTTSSPPNTTNLGDPIIPVTPGTTPSSAHTTHTGAPTVSITPTSSLSSTTLGGIVTGFPPHTPLIDQGGFIASAVSSIAQCNTGNPGGPIIPASRSISNTCLPTGTGITVSMGSAH